MLSARFISVMEEGGRVRLGIYRLHRLPSSQDSQPRAATVLLCVFVLNISEQSSQLQKCSSFSSSTNIFVTCFYTKITKSFM